ncbi:hypothetical protein [Patulibacter minatonensis]|uniref:hypothetical protein n=1 Tax=Patulibacter minatonensis TaxID=298163 RepID=UPI00047E4CEF|nr:hypothetical protein [Patulibacter minatonensis]
MLLGVAGHGLVGAATGRLPWPARGGVAVGTGFLVAAVPLLALADADLFGTVGVAAVGLLLTVVASAGGGRARRVAALPVVLLALAGAAAASIPAYAFDLGGRDAGFYVMTSEHLQRDGGLELTLDRDAREATARLAPEQIGADERRPLPGFFVRDTHHGATTSVVPHGYHLTPAAMAGGGTVTGGAGQWVITLLGAVLVLLAAGAAALLVRPGLRAAASLAAGALLAGNAALIYFSRYPMTEVPSGVVLLTAGLAAAAALRGAGPRVAVLAGAALGAAPLARPDAWPLLVVAPLVTLLLASVDRRAARAFVAGLGPLVVVAALRALTASEAYTKETIGYVLGGVSPTAIVIGLAVLAVGASALGTAVPAAWQARGAVVLGRVVDRPVVLRAAAVVVGLGTVVMVVHPPSLGLEIFGRYATRPGVLLAGVGLGALLLAPPADRRRLVPVVPLLALAGVALALVARDPQVLLPDEYWTARRYLPVALPVTAALAGVAVAVAWGLRGAGRPGRAAAVAAPLVAVLALGLSLSDARQAVTTTEFDGVPARVQRIDALLRGRDPLVIMGPGYTAWGMLGPALALRQDRQVLMLATARRAGQERVATLDDPRLSRWLGRVARRRPVYLVTSNVPQFGIASDPKDVLPVSVGTVELPITQIDHRVGGAPRSHDTTTDLITVSRLQPGSGR